MGYPCATLVAMTAAGWLTIRQYVIYHNARDYPGKYVVRGVTIRRRDIQPDGEPLAVVDTLDQARAAIPPAADVCITRSDNDEPQIVETWI